MNRTRRTAASALVLSLLASLFLVMPGAAEAKPKSGSGSSYVDKHSSAGRMKHVVKKQNPRSKRIKPFKYERNEGRKAPAKPYSVPCSLLAGKPWPSYVKSCT